MRAAAGKRKKDANMLSTMAESIGSTMGRIAGRANAAQKALTTSSEIRSVKREVKKLSGKTKKAGRHTKSNR